MHELYLMQNMVGQIHESAVTQGISHVRRIRLVLGEMSGVDDDALQFAFSVLKEEPLLMDATLEIEKRSIVGVCRKCEQHFPVDNYDFTCPFCQCHYIDILQGRELYIDYYEGI